jgi:alpha/beta superfamily hydrolase
MAEASVAVYVAAIAVAVAVAVIAFVLRRKGHSEGTHDHGSD